MNGGNMTNSELLAAARKAAQHSYSPYSNFAVGAALHFTNGDIVTGANVENASYGLTICAESVAVVKAMSDGIRGGLVAVAVVGPGEETITPCGRCRQMLSELAQLGRTDPDIIMESEAGVEVVKLSALLPRAFGPASLG